MDEAIAAIGSRETPPDVLSKMEHVAKILSHDYWIRTGAAIGADQAFGDGAGERTIVYLPWRNYEATWVDSIGCKIGCTAPSGNAIELASRYHPAWDRCSRGARALHGRNAHIILGKNLDSPVKFVLFWANEIAGEVQGGTGLGVRIARAHDIPCININNNKKWEEQAIAIINKQLKLKGT